MIEFASCFACLKNGAPLQFSIPPTTQRGIMSECPNGHSVGVVFQASGWARLFERGLERIVLGDTRDAVLDLYTAFEMYLAEVPIRARYDRKPGASPTRLRDDLKFAIRCSECAIGAARASTSLASGKPEITWDEAKAANIRNKAVHSGVYPSEQEALELCTEAERTILEFEKTLDSAPCVNPCPYHEAVWREDAEAFQRAHPGVSVVFASGWDVSQWYHTPESRPTATSRIEQYRGHPRTHLRALLDAWVASATQPVAAGDPAAATS